MNPYHKLKNKYARGCDRFYTELETRISERRRTRLLIAFATGFILSQILLLAYATAITTQTQGADHNQDPRTVIFSEAHRIQFQQDFNPDVEEGWCLYGHTNKTHIIIEDIRQSRTTDKSKNRISYTCIPETLAQLKNLENPRLIGDIHSHPGRDRSRISRIDILGWAPTSPVIQVKGVYTQKDGVQFFTPQSLSRPLDRTLSE